MPDIAVLNVLLHGEEIGTLTRVPGDRNLFVFTEHYINNPERSTLSLSFKGVFGELMTDARPTQTRVPPFFANLLPEGRMREYLAEKAEVNPNREFFLLWVLGRDLPGAIELHPADGVSWPEDATEEAQDALHDGDNKAVLRFSLAGVQLKFSAIKEASGGLAIPANGVGGSWIVKLPSTKYNGVPENEFVMMNLARRVGIEVPETELVPVDKIVGLPREMERAGENAFAIKRFDRSADGQRTHIEDFAQIFSVYPERKYRNASYRNIAEVIWTEIGELGIAEFIKRFVFNALIGNGDMHLKNWSMIYPDGRTALLAPAYDFLSTVPYLPNDSLALNFVDSKAFDSLTFDQFSRFGAKARLPEKLVLETAQETVQTFAEAWRDVDDFFIDQEVRKAVEAHLKTVPLWKSR